MFRVCVVMVTGCLGLIPVSYSNAEVIETVTVRVTPGFIRMVGLRDEQQLLVTGVPDAKHQLDLTRIASYVSLNPEVAEVDRTGMIRARMAGTTTIIIRYRDQQMELPVQVESTDYPSRVDFQTEVVAALSRGGCSQGACHGSPQGKNGFRLSLRGYLPELDFETLSRDIFGRRINLEQPNESLFLQKATARVPHQGGKRFLGNERAYQLLARWVTEGCRDSEVPADLSHLEVLPTQRYLHTDSPEQQLVVRAHFQSGTTRDVTHLAVFESSNEEDAKVSAGGLVQFHRTAEVAILVRYLQEMKSVHLTYVRHDPDYFAEFPDVSNEIDSHVFSKHRQLQLTPAPVADEATFLRRVYLDLTGSIPTEIQTLRFLVSSVPDKRARLIDQLLQTPEFASFWALKWADIMRGNRETITERGVHSFHRYLTQVFSEDQPFDQFARDILTSRGNTIHRPQANFYRIARTPEKAAESMAQLFLGVRIQCARCHNHPFESITQNDYYGFMAYFSRVRIKGQTFGLDDEVVYLADKGEVRHPASGEVVVPAAFGHGESVDGSNGFSDRRNALVQWLTESDNPYFSQSTVNRVWYHLLGRGIVEPIDDFRNSNPPSNPALLIALSESFVREGYRLKPLIRKILNSKTYQLRAEPAAARSNHSADPERHFTHAVVRMLSAEQIIDAISSATGVPELFEGYPIGTRAIELAEGNVEHHFLKAFTRPIRDVTCDCARDTEPSLNQVIHLLNNPSVIAKLESNSGNINRWFSETANMLDVVQSIYLATLNRPPTEAEMTLAKSHLQSVSRPEEAFQDLQHALLNSNEFLLRH